jgi:predicted NUDIX family NTP pyrophosphohydrolase
VAKESAGILLYRRGERGTEVLLVHPGGPFWAKKDEGAWSIPKGELAPGEDALTRARTELEEETGAAIEGDFRPLPPCRQAGGKRIRAWTIEGAFHPAALRSNTFLLERPPRSGRRQECPAVVRAQSDDLATARMKINPGQRPLLDELERLPDRTDSYPS